MNFLIATQKEAAPVIAAYKLQKDQGCPYPFYFKDDVRLVISGIGSLQAAGATAYLMGRFPKKNQVWINLGIAGHGSLEYGDIFVAGRILSVSEPTCFYPPQIIESEIPISELTTGNEAQVNYRAEMGYDMEAHGFYQTACLSTTRELVQVLKIVSDNPSTPITEFKPEQATSLIENKLSIIDQWKEALEKASIEIEPPPEVEKTFSLITQTCRFSSTRAHQLKTLLQQASALGVDFDTLEPIYSSAPSSKEIITNLEKLLAPRRILL